MKSDRLRVLYCTGDFKAGGTQRYLLELLRELDRRRFEPTVACLSNRGELRTKMEEIGVPIECYPLGDSLARPRSLGSLLSLARRIRGSFDVVHTLLGHGNIVGLLACVLARERCVVASQRSLHPAHFGSARRGTVFLGRALFRHVAQRVIVNNPAIADALRAQGLAADHIVFIPNGIDTTRFQPLSNRSAERRKAGLDPRGPIVGYVGRMIPEKGFPRVLAAVERLIASHPEIRVLAVGDGPARESFERIASGGALRGRVDFSGFRIDPERIYPLLDVFAFPSTYEEGTPHVVLEAMSCGIPAVVRRMVQMESVIRDGDNGLFVSSDSPDELARALDGLLRQPDRASAIGRAAREFICARHSLETTVRSTERIYEEEAARFHRQTR